MLMGQAKKDYQREYMRKRRAGEPTIKPKVAREWQPTYRVISEIERWIKYPWRTKQALRDITKGLKLALPEWPEAIGMADIAKWQRYFPIHEAAVLDYVRSDPDWQEAFRRYRAHKDALKAERERKKWEEPDQRYCLFCYDGLTTTGKLFVNTGYNVICETCVDTFADAISQGRANKAA
jgi:hypothetical protein